VARATKTPATYTAASIAAATTATQTTSATTAAATTAAATTTLDTTIAVSLDCTPAAATTTAVTSVGKCSNRLKLFRVKVGTGPEPLHWAFPHENPVRYNWAGVTNKYPKFQHDNFKLSI
jgi:hypothetical protein